MAKLILRRGRKPPKLARRRQPSYILRNIDEELWARVRDRCELEGKSIRWVILELLHAYANQDVDFSL